MSGELNFKKLTGVDAYNLDPEEVEILVDCLHILNINYTHLFSEEAKSIDKDIYSVKIEDVEDPEIYAKTHIHNYLASLFSLREIIYNITNTKIDTKETEYPPEKAVSEVKYLIGLRNIIQHNGLDIIETTEFQREVTVEVKGDSFEESCDVDASDFLIFVQEPANICRQIQKCHTTIISSLLMEILEVYENRNL